MKITSVKAKTIQDSRGADTIELTIETETYEATASVPAGKSTGSFEANALPAHEAVNTVDSTIAPTLVGKEFGSPNEIDVLLLSEDGTEYKEKLGGNVLLAVSIAATRLFAKAAGVPLWKYIAEENDFTSGFPHLYMNTLNGGAHADFVLPFQEYIIVPKETAPAAAYAKAQELFKQVGKVVGDVELGDEGGYKVRYDNVRKPFEVLQEISQKDAFIAIDAAATEFNRGNMYMLHGESYNRDQMLELYDEIIKEFDLVSVEDPFAEDDIDDFQVLVRDELTTLVIGDDLTVTNPKIVKKMVEKKAMDGLIIKPNQVGTLKEVYETVHMVHGAGMKCIASHRSGETMDSFIADLAVAIGAFGIKAGAPTQKERVAKYERLLEIEKEFTM